MSRLVKSAGDKVVGSFLSTSRAFVDHKLVKCVGGRGGNGALAFSKHGPHHLVGPGLPVGGRGGNGGSVFAEPVKRPNERADLSRIPSVVVAKNGQAGKGSKINGRPGDDVVLRMPIGTLIYKFEPADEVENWRAECRGWPKKLLADIKSTVGFDSDSILNSTDSAQEHERVLLAAGAQGGLGNDIRSPYESQPGCEPLENYYEIRLKLIADVGLLGLPNVGKSTLFSTVGSQAISPDHAALQQDRRLPIHHRLAFRGPRPVQRRYLRAPTAAGASLSVVDLPGVVESSVGNAFVQHLERVKLIVYVVDPCNPAHQCVDNFNLLRRQLAEHGLDHKPFVVVTSKMDVASKLSSLQADRLQQHLFSLGLSCSVVPVSAKYSIGLEKLVRELRRSLETIG